MKKSLRFVLIFILNLVPMYGQNGWNADIRVYSEHYIQSTEVNVNMIVDLYYNNSLVSPQSGYTYYWWRRDVVTNEQWHIWDTTYGYDNLSGTHCCQPNIECSPGGYAQHFDLYCKVTIPGSGSVISDTIRIPWYSVLPDQKEVGGTSFGSVNYWYKANFRDNNGLDTVYIPQDNPIVLQADTNVVLNPQEKYYYWKNDQSGQTFYDNFVKFYPEDLLNTPMVSHFNYTNNAAVRSKVDNSYLDVVKFKDPWFRDYNEIPYGMRNQGLTAQYQSLAITSNNLGINTNHQGVFLGLDPSNGAQAYYSVRAPLAPIVNGANAFFSGWTTSGGVSLQQVDPNTSGYDQKAVVFTSGGAV